MPDDSVIADPPHQTDRPAEAGAGAGGKGASDLSWNDYDAVLFDLDGVLTPTAEVHMRAWDTMFNDYLEQRPDAGRLARYTASDYFAHVDGKPRFDGVRTFLASRDIELPEGTPDDPPDAETVGGLGNRKNAMFSAILERDGVEPYPASVTLLDWLADRGTQVAVVSSSRNAPLVLEAAGLADRFEHVVDGRVAAEAGLAGKPSPETYLHAARLLGTEASRAVVVEDALSGVESGRAGDFGLVVGVDRGAGREALLGAGADVVVRELDELVPGRSDG
ncbi:HAD family hydrolase [Terracoccus luteus]|uniref:Beta-phosphoglucomutase n=1 Tax=Terracoccus luteus TaxID=53356 RepID=A0A839PS14_9MICO|nr:beta-phosphoglucomutase family hydrolase [Terracoccus luteus]MBB2985853.1 beta-phosphoglucomutase family hydrolase [Terracoccus luteus]MCP2171505.1 beta-phosphoglucomutase family hydrolase [Terracoccus luteus]